MISSGIAEAYIISSFSFLLSSFSNILGNDKANLVVGKAIEFQNINASIIFFGIAILLTGVLRISTIRITSFVPALIANDLSSKIISNYFTENMMNIFEPIRVSK